MPTGPITQGLAAAEHEALVATTRLPGRSNWMRTHALVVLPEDVAGGGVVERQRGWKTVWVHMRMTSSASAAGIMLRRMGRIGYRRVPVRRGYPAR